MCVIPVQVFGDIVLIDGVSLEAVGEAKACAHLRVEERKISIKGRVPWGLSTRPHTRRWPNWSWKPRLWLQISAIALCILCLMEASCFPWKGKSTSTGSLYLDAFMNDGEAIINNSSNQWDREPTPSVKGYPPLIPLVTFNVVWDGKGTTMLG